MKVAFAYWEKRIAPVFDTAHNIHIVEVESGQVIGESLGSLTEAMPSSRALRLAELGIGTLVCGAISGTMQKLLEAYGIQVISFVAGNTKDVIHAWLEGKIHDGLFFMPGCGKGNRHRHRGMNGSRWDGPVVNKNARLTGKVSKGSKMRNNKT
jgi:predicted Fe-Mo cluster-binding NifX family protein